MYAFDSYEPIKLRYFYNRKKHRILNISYRYSFSCFVFSIECQVYWISIEFSVFYGFVLILVKQIWILKEILLIIIIILYFSTDWSTSIASISYEKLSAYYRVPLLNINKYY